MKTLALFLLLAVVASAATPSPVILPLITYSPGGTITFKVTAWNEPLTYQWYLGAAKLKTPDAQSPVLVLKPPYAAGLYVCEVTNPGGKLRTSPIRIATTTVKDAAQIAITLKK